MSAYGHASAVMTIGVREMQGQKLCLVGEDMEVDESAPVPPTDHPALLARA